MSFDWGGFLGSIIGVFGAYRVAKLQFERQINILNKEKQINSIDYNLEIYSQILSKLDCLKTLEVKLVPFKSDEVTQSNYSDLENQMRNIKFMYNNIYLIYLKVKYINEQSLEIKKILINIFLAKDSFKIIEEIDYIIAGANCRAQFYEDPSKSLIGKEDDEVNVIDFFYEVNNFKEKYNIWIKTIFELTQKTMYLNIKLISEVDNNKELEKNFKEKLIKESELMKSEILEVRDGRV